MAKNTIKVLEIVSRPPSFWRAGRMFTTEPIQIPLAELTQNEIKALKAEKNLVVVEKEVADELEDVGGTE